MPVLALTVRLNLIVSLSLILITSCPNLIRPLDIFFAIEIK